MSSKRRSILHIGKFYPPHRGGIETHVRDLVRHQTSRFDVTVMVSSSSRRSVTEQLDGAQIRRFARIGTLASMPICPGLFGQIRSIRPDLIHLHVPNPLGAAVIRASGFRGPIVITHHSDVLGRPTLRRMADIVVQFVYTRAAVILATSERYLNSSEELLPFREKCRVVPLGIDLNEHQNESHSAPLVARDSSRAMLVSIGRLVPYKGFEYLIDAMRPIDADLLIIGDGPLYGALVRRIEIAGLSRRIRIVRSVQDVRPYLASSDIFVLPSVTRAEAFGVVQLEAMAFGLPVINTLIDSGVPEVSLHELTGLTVPPANSEALSSAIAKLVADPLLCRAYGAAARKRVREYFDVQVMAEQIDLIYDELFLPSRALRY